MPTLRLSDLASPICSVTLALAAVVAGCSTDAAPTDPGAEAPARDAGGGRGCGCRVDGECRVGNTTSACGRGGEECTACTGEAKCIDGVCRAPARCGPSTCKGCCRPDDTCAEGTAADACGTGGGLCETCTGSTCTAGKCQVPCNADNCVGCCKPDGTCSTGKQPDDACGASGDACAPCGANEVCSPVFVVVEGSPNAPAQAGACTPKDCAACTAGCCSSAAGGGVQCLAGTAATACGGNGKTCSACGANETCTNKTCAPKPTVRFKLVLVSATLPAQDSGGSSWDFLSNPDVGIVVRIKTTPETVSTRVDGPDDTTTPTFIGGTAITAKLEDFKKGIVFDVVDRDTPDPEDPMGSVPAAPFVPSDAAFLSGAAPIEVGTGALKVKFRFVRE